MKDIFLTTREVVKVSLTSGILRNALAILMTPFRIPARCASSARANNVKGVSPGDFATTIEINKASYEL